MQHTGADWVTNDREVASKLRAADDRYDVALARARSLPLRDKIEALSIAKARRQAEYDAITMDR